MGHQDWEAESHWVRRLKYSRWVEILHVTYATCSTLTGSSGMNGSSKYLMQYLCALAVFFPAYFWLFCGLQCERRLRIRLIPWIWSALALLARLRRKHQGRYWLLLVGICCHFCKRLSQRAIEEVQEQIVPNSAQLQHSKFTKQLAENISNMVYKYRTPDKDSDLRVQLHLRIGSSELRA